MVIRYIRAIQSLSNRMEQQNAFTRSIPHLLFLLFQILVHVRFFIPSSGLKYMQITVNKKRQLEKMIERLFVWLDLNCFPY